MPGHVAWDNKEKTILLNIYEGDVTKADYFYMINKTEQLVSEQSHVVHVIHDRTKVDSQPSSMAGILRYANNHTPSNLGLRILIGISGRTKFAMDIGRLIAPNLIKDVFFARDMEDARQQIYDHIAGNAAGV